MKTRLLYKGLFLGLSSQFMVQAWAQPGNNTCANATTLSPAATPIAGSVYNATWSNPTITSSCHTGTADDDVWYKFTATSTDAQIILSNVGAGFVASGVRMQLLSNNCGSTFTSIACADKNILKASALSVGTQYFVRVYPAGSGQTGWVAADGAFSISVAPVITGSDMREVFLQTNLSPANALDDPWEVTYGSDNYLWITEAKGYRVVRMNPTTGQRDVVLDVSRGSTFLPDADTAIANCKFDISANHPQGGLAGLALHPAFGNGTGSQAYVFVSYVQRHWGGGTPNGIHYKNAIIRFKYNSSSKELESPMIVCDTLPGSSDHNSQRMIIAPYNGTNYLFYASGDMGSGQFNNVQRPIRAQDVQSYEGKILRFNVDPDGDAGAYDKWIPSGAANKNPYNSYLGHQSAVWCTGIRNNQGFAYGLFNGIGKLFGTSHGPYSDDELNVIEPEMNYGHPLVIGDSADNNYRNARAGHKNVSYNTIMPLITNEGAAAAALKNTNNIANYRNPLFSAYASTPSNVYNIWNTNNTGSGAVPNAQWPSEAWSGLDLYKSTVIPGWKNSLLAACLKWGRLMRLQLNNTGTAITAINDVDTMPYFQSRNRYRDIAFDPNGRDIYVAMDKSAASSGPTDAWPPVVAACPGCLQKYTFLGYADSSASINAMPATVSYLPKSIQASPGTAETCNAATTVNINDSNNHLWVPITGADGNIVAEINAMGQTLGDVQTAFFLSANVRNTGGRRFLGRNIFLNPTIAAAGIKLRLYVSEAEFLTWKGATPNAITDLRLFQNADGCSSSPVSSMTVISGTPNHAYKHGSATYVLQMNSINIAAAGSSFYLGNDGTFTLPVTDLTFTGSLQNRGAVLNWKVESELGTKAYAVERSTNGTVFNSIASVAASGVARKANHQLNDGSVFGLSSSLVFYRLRIIDHNDAVSYSNTVTVSLNTAVLVSVTPNPVTGMAQIRMEPKRTGLVEWQLFDGASRLVSNGNMYAAAGIPCISSLNMTGLAQGPYYFQVRGAGINQHIRLQKM